MARITFVTPQFAVAGALGPDDFAAVAAQGFKAVISNLPDGESPGHLAAAEAARLAAEAGLAFRHIPTTRIEVFSERVLGDMGRALAELNGPILAHCASGGRSALAWAAAAARYQSVDCVLATLSAAGFAFDPMREELEEHRVASLTGAIPRALDCNCGEAAKPA